MFKYYTHRIYIIAFSILLLVSLSVPFSVVYGATLSKAPNNLGLVGYWPLNEGVGTITNDLSGKGNTGTTTSTTWVNGKRGKALSFNGSSAYTNVSFSSSLPTGQGARTISVWVYQRSRTLETTSALVDILNGGSGQSFTFALALISATNCINAGSSPNIFLFTDSVNGNNNICITGSQIPSLNAWHHVVLTFDGGTGFTYYLDGVSSLSGNFATTINTHTSGVNIGRRGSTVTGYTDAILDDVRIYNRALSASDVLNLYKSGQVTRKMVSNSGLVGYWPLNDGTGTVASDMSGNGKTGTLTGGTWTAGKRGGALSFNGTSDKVTGGNITVGTTMTISAWIKKNASTGQKSFFSNRSGSGRVYLGLSNTNVFMYDSSATPAPVNSAAGTVQIGQWQHIVATNDGSTTIFYVNGVQVLSTSQVRTASTGAFGIGWDPSIGTEYWDGLIDDVRVYSRVLSSAEVLALYKQNETAINHSQNSRMTSGLVGFWSFNGQDYNSASTTAEILDRSGSGNNGDNIGSTQAIGKVGQGLSFNGSTNYVSVRTSSSAIMTISFWGKVGTPSNNENFGIAFHDATTGLQKLSVVLNDAGELGVASSFNAWQKMKNGYTSLQNDGRWHLFSFVVNKSDYTQSHVYLDGAEVSSYTTQANTTFNSDDRFYMNRLNVPSSSRDDYATGSLDEVRIYNRALSASEVKQLYDMGR